MKNIDDLTVTGFGDEWSKFDQTKMSNDDAYQIFNGYFSIFPWDLISKNSIGFDLGCGSGRWAKLIAPHVSKLHCIDPSKAIDIAKDNLKSFNNCKFHQSSVDDMPLDNHSMDFGYSLGVLHHIPNTQEALKTCVSKLKSGAPFLLYLYYAFDNRPVWYRLTWKVSNLSRLIISKMPFFIRYHISQIIACIIYWPLARTAKLLEIIGVNIKNFPLMFYRNYSFYIMRTDALDRFGTRLEQRFTKKQIIIIMEKAGLRNIKFNENEPFWCALGYAK